MVKIVKKRVPTICLTDERVWAEIILTLFTLLVDITYAFFFRHHPYIQPRPYSY